MVSSILGQLGPSLVRQAVETSASANLISPSQAFQTGSEDADSLHRISAPFQGRCPQPAASVLPLPLAGKRDRRWFRFSPPLSRQACRDSREGCAHRECCLPCLLLLGLLCLGQGHPRAPHRATTGTQRARYSSATPILPNPQQLRKNYYFCLFFCLSRCPQSVLCACTVILPL